MLCISLAHCVKSRRKCRGALVGIAAVLRHLLEVVAGAESRPVCRDDDRTRRSISGRTVERFL